MRRFSVRPTLTLRGRTFKGLRGWSGKPTHPPLTDFPIAAYILAAAFDVIATFGRRRVRGRRVSSGRAPMSSSAGPPCRCSPRSRGSGTGSGRPRRGRRPAEPPTPTRGPCSPSPCWRWLNIALRLNDYDRTYPTPAILVLSIVVARSSRWALPSAEPSCSTTASTSRRRGTARCGIRRRPTSSPAITRNEWTRSAIAADVDDPQPRSRAVGAGRSISMLRLARSSTCCSPWVKTPTPRS